MALDDDDDEDDARPASDDDSIARDRSRGAWAVVVVVVVVVAAVFAAAVARINATIAIRFKVAILLVSAPPEYYLIKMQWLIDITAEHIIMIK